MRSRSLSLILASALLACASAFAQGEAPRLAADAPDRHVVVPGDGPGPRPRLKLSVPTVPRTSFPVSPTESSKPVATAPAASDVTISPWSVVTPASVAVGAPASNATQQLKSTAPTAVAARRNPAVLVIPAKPAAHKTLNAVAARSEQLAAIQPSLSVVAACAAEMTGSALVRVSASRTARTAKPNAVGPVAHRGTFAPAGRRARNARPAVPRVGTKRAAANRNHAAAAGAAANGSSAAAIGPAVDATSAAVLDVASNGELPFAPIPKRMEFRDVGHRENPLLKENTCEQVSRIGNHDRRQNVCCRAHRETAPDEG